MRVAIRFEQGKSLSFVRHSLDAPESYQAVCDKLQALRPGALVGIEGFCSSGKSTFADRLGADIQADVIHTDSFAIKFDQPPPYINCLKLDELRGALALRQKTKHCIVEGICLRDVLVRCNAEADFYLYVKRIGQNGLWYDELHLEAFESADPVDGDEIEPHLSDLKYHSRKRPHELADAVFHRIEDGVSDAKLTGRRCAPRPARHNANVRPHRKVTAWQPPKKLKP